MGGVFLPKAIVLIMSVVLIFTIVFSIALLMSEQQYGFEGTDVFTLEYAAKDLRAAGILATCSTLGIFSKHIYDLMQSSAPSREVVSFRALLRTFAISLILSPVVLISFIDQLKQFSSPIFGICSTPN